MITIGEKSTIVSLSELRTKSDEILKHLAEHKVILQKHNRPVAVMLAFKQYAYLEKLLDLAEEYVLGRIAKERDKASTAKDFVDIEKWKNAREQTRPRPISDQASQGSPYQRR